MKLDDIELTAIITKNEVTKKRAVYEYLFSDENAVEECGLGPRYLTVSGLVKTAADRDALEQACQSGGVKKLYFPSAQGEDDDRYYKVQTMPVSFVAETASVYRYTFECIAADSSIYDADTDEVIW